MAQLDRDLEEGRMLMPKLRNLPGLEAKRKLNSFTADTLVEHASSLVLSLSTQSYISMQACVYACADVHLGTKQCRSRFSI